MPRFIIKKDAMKKSTIMKFMARRTGRNTGSLTVEACIIFPVFLFFILLFFFGVQLACVAMALDHGVSETAKKLAASAYPLALLNAAEDELLPGEQLPAGILQGLKPFLPQEKERLARQLLEQYTAGSLVKKELLLIRQVELPVSAAQCADVQTFSPVSLLIPEIDYDRDDVAVQVEYNFPVPLPFVEKPLTLRFAAVERAWLNGGNGVYTRKDEKGIFARDDKNETVYVTRTGSKYHRSGCMYLRKSRIPLLLQDAEKEYRPCKVCWENGY